MKTLPICKVCAKTGVLCTSCESKLEKGEISELEIELSKTFLELEKKHPGLKNVNFYGALEKDNLIVLIVGKGEIDNVRGEYGKTRKALSEKFKKTIRIIEKSKDPKKILEDLIYPIPVLGINQIFLPTGEVENKARINEKDFSKLPIDKEILEDIIYTLTGTQIRIVPE